ncbi:peptidoglycan bridge formation protein FemAB [Nocardioides baekrokdamisoli]|uniref:Peptidoglycan bridge formation protein FemAB n=1 Tax=Nocardioides baekrokdamisoli TaxID=1804624 RepID=A0A3G9J331_9ACTN|nr:peptidoglycan bridge formation protein FemAB [Nocardioides baekrokdamisoli]
MIVRPISAAEHLAYLDQRIGDASVSFLQTPAWARVKTEWRAESLGFFPGEVLSGVALVLHRPVPKLKKTTLAYVPEGPVLDWEGDTADALTSLAAYLKKGGAFAVRIGPPVVVATWTAEQVKQGIADESIARLTDLTPSTTNEAGAKLTTELKAAGWQLQSPEDGFGAGQPQFTYEIPLAGRTEQDLLSGMNQLWRRNIKKADKEGVVVTRVLGGTDDDLQAFHDLYVHTAERDHFTPRGVTYFKVMRDAMQSESNQRFQLFLAHHEGDLVAATIYVQVGAHTWYSYGASSTEKRDVRGSNAIQWAMIRAALEDGAAVYDLRGITPTLDPADSHVGLIQFKVGTGGQAVQYVGEWDLPLRPLIHKAFQMYMGSR